MRGAESCLTAVHRREKHRSPSLLGIDLLEVSRLLSFTVMVYRRSVSCDGRREIVSFTTNHQTG